MKRGGSNHFDGLNTQQSLGLVLKKLLKLRDAEIFKSPVDWKGMGLDDYPTIIKEPMDLGTMMEKNNQGKYHQNDGIFWSDLELIWHNCELYNGADGAYGRIAQKMRESCSRIQSQYLNKSNTTGGVVDGTKRSNSRNVRREDSNGTRTKKVGRPPSIKKEMSTDESNVTSGGTSTSGQQSSHESKIIAHIANNIPSGSKGSYMRSTAELPQDQEIIMKQQQTPIITEPFKIHDSKNAAIAAAVSVRMLQLNACALTILIRYVMNLQASRPEEEKRSGPIIRPNTLEEKHGVAGEQNQSASQRESVRLDIGRLEIHELKAVYQLVERMIESGLVHQYDQAATADE